MDGSDFDVLTRTLTASLSRRITLGGLVAGVLAALDATPLLAKKKDKGKGKDKKKGKGRNANKCPKGLIRCGGRCQTCCTDNECVSPLGYCVAGQCVECLRNGEQDPACGLNWGSGVFPYCVNHQCRNCITDSDCAERYPPTFTCRDYQCAACTSDAECRLSSPDYPYCIAAGPARQCYQCRTDEHCSELGTYCFGGLCVPHCGNGQFDGDESATDCGGSCAQKCANGQGCFQPADCASGVCENGECVGIPPTICPDEQQGSVVCGGTTHCACYAWGPGNCADDRRGCQCICCENSLCANGEWAGNCGGQCCCGRCNSFDPNICEPD